MCDCDHMCGILCGYHRQQAEDRAAARAAAVSVIDEEDTTTDQPPVSPLVADLIGASLQQTHATANYLIDSLTAQLAERDAKLAAIRAGVMDLIDGDWMPTPAAIQRALYPGAGDIDAYREGAP
jgi:hypothetical protein